jgi:hypothetical protein
VSESKATSGGADQGARKTETVRYPENTSIVLTKAEASRRHIEAAIIAFEEERFDVTITLAGGAEGMAPEGGASLFQPLRDHSTIAEEGVEVRWPPAGTPQASPRRGGAGKGTVPKDEGQEKKRDWIKVLNEEYNWLKHAGEPNHPSTCEFHRFAAAIWLVRAISKAHAAFGVQSTTIDAFIETFRRSWTIDVDTVSADHP